MALDDLFVKFKDLMLALGLEELKSFTGLRSDYIERICGALHDSKMRQLNQLARVNGIDDKTLEKAFAFVRNESNGVPTHVQQRLDF